MTVKGIKSKEKNGGKKLLRNYFRDSVDYIIESKNYIYFIIGLFIFSFAVGFVFHEKFIFLEDLLVGIIKKTEHLSGFDLILFIFKNNLWSAFVSMMFGIFFGIIPLISCMLNGSVLGYVAQKVFVNEGVQEFCKILPHGIFELPAIFLSMAFGLKIGMFVFSKNKARELKRRIYNSAIIFLFIILPLLIVAAMIEGILITLLK